jgi:hypothetical protein
MATLGYTLRRNQVPLSPHSKGSPERGNCYNHFHPADSRAYGNASRSASSEVSAESKSHAGNTPKIWGRKNDRASAAKSYRNSTAKDSGVGTCSVYKSNAMSRRRDGVRIGESASAPCDAELRSQIASRLERAAR